MRLHGRIARGSSAATRWQAIVQALVDTAPGAAPADALLQKLQKVLERGDPALDERLAQWLAVPIEPAADRGADAALELPSVAEGAGADVLL